MAIGYLAVDIVRYCQCQAAPLTAGDDGRPATWRNTLLFRSANWLFGRYERRAYLHGSLLADRRRWLRMCRICIASACDDAVRQLDRAC